MNAEIIIKEIKEQGYEGKMTILRDFMKPYRKQVSSKASVRFEVPPENTAK